jgi:hypothetical protein
MFRSLFYDHPQGLSFVLIAFTTFPLLASSFAIHIDGIRPHTLKAKDEESIGKAVNALSTKNNL